MKRLTNPPECRKITDKHLTYFTFDADEWFAKEENYALVEGENIAFAEYKSPGVYWVHFCFDEARGREAVILTERIFTEFCRVRSVKMVIGFITLGNRKARWLIRQAGFNSLGEILTEIGMCEMFFKLPDNSLFMKES